MVLLSLPPIALSEFRDYTCTTPSRLVFLQAELGVSGLSDGLLLTEPPPQPPDCFISHLFMFCISLYFRKYLLSASLIYHSMLRQRCNVYPEM